MPAICPSFATFAPLRETAHKFPPELNLLVSRKGAKAQRSQSQSQNPSGFFRRRMMTENEIAKHIVDAALKVHKRLGPGLLESVYEAVLAAELERR